MNKGGEVDTLHTPFAKWLRDLGIESIHARSDMESTITPGWPDFTILFPDRPALMIEFKMPKTGKESADQERVRLRLTAKGYKSFVVRELSAAIEIVNEWRKSDEPMKPIAKREPFFIRNREGFGDWVASGAQWLRRATIEDAKMYPRG